jgi:hypothetical protein
MGAIVEIFRNFGPEYMTLYPDMPLQHKKTIEAIINCRLSVIWRRRLSGR